MADGARLALPVFPTAATRDLRMSRVWVVVAVGAITALAACLRIVSLSKVGDNPFYDAAVRSMGDSLRNFFFGAFEPSGSVSVDKPPVDLWLQVASVKAFGFSGIALKLPEAIGGTLAVPLLFDALRRVFGTASGLCAALALAVLPEAVLTSRSDTMDSVMALLLVAALWCLIRAAQTRHSRWVVIAAACVGVAFNVKLLEAFVPVPAFAVGAWFACRGPAAARFKTLAVALVVLIAVSLSWLSATSIVGSEPYAIGSTNGSPWNAAFIFNGLDRINPPPPVAAPATAAAQQTTAPRRAATQPRKVTGTDLDVRLQITPPGVARLFSRGSQLPVTRLGLELLAALLLGLPALWMRRREGPGAVVAGVTIGLWLVIGFVFFSKMARLHPRYMEAMSPAIAAAMGVGIAWLGNARGRLPMVAAAVAIAIAAFAVWATSGSAVAILGLVATALGAIAVVWAAFGRATRNQRAARLAPWGVAFVLCGLLAAPMADAIHIVNVGLSDSGRPGEMPDSRVAALSSFFTANRDGARYEFATMGATKAGELIARDNAPVLVLTTFQGRPLVTPDVLSNAVDRGQVRYAMLGGTCVTYDKTNPACSPAVKWVHAHGIDVSKQAGVYSGLVWELGPQAERIHRRNDAIHARTRQRRAHLDKIARSKLGPVVRRHQHALQRRELRSRRAARRRALRHRHDHAKH
jgi:4-amino-4-deoxy-L-arabinose transferase-like glycosyltransferase